MRINMSNLPTGSICQMEEFLKSNTDIKMAIEKEKDKYKFIKEVLLKTRYTRYNTLRKREKIIIIRYLKKLCGYSKSHVKKLIKDYQKGILLFNEHRARNKFPVKYFAEDIGRLIDTDTAHQCLNGKTTKEIMRREVEVFGHLEYENISKISVSHLYNIRNHNRQYASSPALFFKHTQATTVNIGERRKPQPYGKPGYLRVDTVHQGDLDKVKGVYHINIIDEVTQYEMVATVEKITQQNLVPVLKELISLFPFKICEFHSDNGSEYINQLVADMLNDLLIGQTKSRAWKSNDNAQIESKNGSIIRKLYGRNFIDQKFARIINEFNQKYVNDYLNYHRPCLFAEESRDKLGKIRKKYRITMTPYEKLKSLPEAEKYLKPGITFSKLDEIAYQESDNEYAEKMMKAKEILFKKIKADLTN